MKPVNAENASIAEPKRWYIIPIVCDSCVTTLAWCYCTAKAMWVTTLSCTEWNDRSDVIVDFLNQWTRINLNSRLRIMPSRRDSPWIITKLLQCANGDKIRLYYGLVLNTTTLRRMSSCEETNYFPVNHLANEDELSFHSAIHGRILPYASAAAGLIQ